MACFYIVHGPAFRQKNNVHFDIQKHARFKCGVFCFLRQNGEGSHRKSGCLLRLRHDVENDGSFGRHLVQIFHQFDLIGVLSEYVVFGQQGAVFLVIDACVRIERFMPDRFDFAFLEQKLKSGERPSRRMAVAVRVFVIEGNLVGPTFAPVGAQSDEGTFLNQSMLRFELQNVLHAQREIMVGFSFFRFVDHDEGENQFLQIKLFQITGISDKMDRSIQMGAVLPGERKALGKKAVIMLKQRRKLRIGKRRKMGRILLMQRHVNNRKESFGFGMEMNQDFKEIPSLVDFVLHHCYIIHVKY